MKNKRVLYLGLDPSRYEGEHELTHLPLIRIEPRPLEGVVKNAFLNFENFTHVLFTSRSAVAIFLDYAQKLSLVDVHKKKYICVGTATAELLSDYQTLYPQEQTAEGVVELLKTLDLRASRIFFPHSKLSRPVIFQYLERNAISFQPLVLYDTVFNPVNLPSLDEYDELVFTSPSTVHAFAKLTHQRPLPSRCVAIGPITKKVLNHFIEF